MRRNTPRKGAAGDKTERRKTPRGKPAARARKASSTVPAATKAKRPGPSTAARARAGATANLDPDSCRACGSDLADDARAIFVEEEVGRVFCSEACITAHFTTDIERLEKEYFRKLSSDDLSPEERDSLNHLRWITLQEPDEVWREKTLTGDYRYYLISEYRPGNQKIWCVCICLFLRGEPSFLYLAFPTRVAAMVSHYRKGERVEIERKSGKGAKGGNAQRFPSRHAEGSTTGDAVQGTATLDRLATTWTEDETMRAELLQGRSPDDIPPEEFKEYQNLLEQTLETPDEVWSVRMGAPEGSEGGEAAAKAATSEAVETDAEAATKDASELEAMRIYHFIRHYPEEKPGVWFIIVARETEDEEQIEILDAFPSRDAALVQRYRRGEQEVGPESEPMTPASRVVH